MYSFPIKFTNGNFFSFLFFIIYYYFLFFFYFWIIFSVLLLILFKKYLKYLKFIKEIIHFYSFPIDTKQLHIKNLVVYFYFRQYLVTPEYVLPSIRSVSALFLARFLTHFITLMNIIIGFLKMKFIHK